MSRRALSRALVVASIAAGSAGCLAFLRAALAPHRQVDFLIYYMGGVLGRTQGWAHLYEFGRQRALLEALWSHPEWMPYWNPPPLAWLVAPLTLLPFRLALVAWWVIMAGLLVLAWAVAAPPGRRARVVSIGLLAGSMPVLVCLGEGQVVPALAASIAGTLVLIRSGRPWLAGLVLAAIALKPQPVFLVPLALAAAGQWRTFGAWAGATAGLAAASVLVLGTTGLHSLLADLGVAQTWTQPPYTIAGVASGPAALALRAVTAGGALAVSYRWRSKGPGIPIVAGMVGSLATTPFTHLQDLTLLFVAGWIALSADPGPRQRLFAFAGFVCLEMAVAFGQPVLLVEVAWLAAMLLARPRAAERVGEGPAAGRHAITAPARWIPGRRPA